MGSLITNEELTIQLEHHIPSCTELNIISAFVTKPAISWLSKLTAINEPLISIVGRFTPQDFIAGASSIDAIRTCLNNGYKVKALNNLHAKIYQIDQNIIFTGSANLTGKGLALVDEGNLESCTQVEACELSKKFINKILEAATEITCDILDKMEAFIDEFSLGDNISVESSWPESVMSKVTDIFVSDFPLSKPGLEANAYIFNPALEFAIIEKNQSDFEIAKRLFKRSKAYLWLKGIVVGNDGRRDLGFGQLSRLLHDALSDDPAPYRCDIKELQANLYDYIVKYATDEIIVYVPGRRSQVLKLIK